MRRIATLAALGVLVLLLLVAQVALPAIAEDRVEDRLTQGGGSADVDLDALPAARLLFKEGDRVRVRARGIELPLVAPSQKVLGDLDGFDDVDVAVSDSRAGPFQLESLTLERTGGDASYRTAIKGSVTPGDLASFG